MQWKQKIDEQAQSHVGDSETETEGRLRSRLSPGPVTTDPFREEWREKKGEEQGSQTGGWTKQDKSQIEN